MAALFFFFKEGGAGEQKSTLREAAGLKVSSEGSQRDKVTAVESCHTIDH